MSRFGEENTAVDMASLAKAKEAKFSNLPSVAKVVNQYDVCLGPYTQGLADCCAFSVISEYDEEEDDYHDRSLYHYPGGLPSEMDDEEFLAILAKLFENVEGETKVYLVVGPSQTVGLGEKRIQEWQSQLDESYDLRQATQFMTSQPKDWCVVYCDKTYLGSFVQFPDGSYSAINADDA